jgi:long-chain acyl-CoA synthetase
VVIGDQRPYPILLVVPNFDVLTAWAAAEHIQHADRTELAADTRVHAKLEAEAMRRLEGFARFEMPKKILVLPREFDLAAGEVTPKLSVRRHVVAKTFSTQIEALYAEAQPAPSEAH